MPPGPWSTAQRTPQQGVSAGILARLRHHSIDAPPSPPTEAFVKVVTYFWVRARVGGRAILHAVRPELRDLCRLFGRCQVIFATRPRYTTALCRVFGWDCARVYRVIAESVPKPCVAMPIISRMPGFCPLEESPLIKGNGLLPFICRMRPLIGGRSVKPFC